MLVALCAVVVAVILGQARVALADEGLRVEGMDYFYGSSAAGGSADSSVDILSVSGAANQTVYVEMDRDGVTIASHLAFTLGDSTAKRDGAGRYVGVVSAKIANFQPMSTYGVRVFTDREQTQSLFEGSITPVFADLDGAPRRLLALRTVASGDDRAFTAPANVTFGNASYKLANDAPVSEAPLAFSYTQSDADEPIDGVVRYVDAQGKVLRTDSIPGIAKGEHRSVPVPSVITVGEGASASWWRTVGYAGSVEASYPGVSDFTVRCVPLASGEGSANAGNYYFAGIRFVDAATGRRVLAPSDEAASTYDDSLNVCGRYLYTPPTRLFATDANGVAQTYVLNAAASHLSDAGALELDSAKDGVTDGFKAFDVTYDRQPSDAATTWTVVIVNGAADPKGSDREIARRQFEVRPGETATFTPLDLRLLRARRLRGACALRRHGALRELRDGRGAGREERDVAPRASRRARDRLARELLCRRHRVREAGRAGGAHLAQLLLERPRLHHLLPRLFRRPRRRAHRSRSRDLRGWHAGRRLDHVDV